MILDSSKADAKEVTTKLDLKAVYDKVDNRFKRNQSQSPTGTGASSKSNTSGSTSASYASKQQSQSDTKDGFQTAVGSTLRNRKKKTGQSGFEGSYSSVLESTLSKPLKALGSNSVASSRSHSVSNGIDESYGNNNPANGNLNTASKKQLDSSKKKKNAAAQSNSSGGNNQKKEGKTSSLMSFGGLTLGKMTNGCSSKTEEETSSTTTEGSNPDDVMMAVMMVRCDEEMREKERTLSGKSASSGSSSDSYNCLKSKNSIAKDRKGSGKENGLSQYLTDFEDFTRKKSNKKKGFGSSGRRGKLYCVCLHGCIHGYGSLNNFRPILLGSVSPNHDSTLWDTPHSPSGDGLSELAAQTQAFVMNRPSKGRSLDRQQQSSPNGSTSKSPIMVGGGSNYSTGTTTSTNRNQTRKPGVIGQHRVLSQLQQPGSQHNPSSSIGAVITAALTMAMTTSSTSSGSTSGSRQHTPPVRTTSSTGWGSEILPDNGCDIWNRKNSLENGGCYSSTAATPYNMRVAGSSSRPDMSAFSVTSNYFPSQNGFSPSPTSLQSSHNLSSHNQSLHNSSHGFNSRHSPKGSTVGPDSGYLFSSGGALSNDVLGNMWQANSPFDSSALGHRVSGSTPSFSPSAYSHASVQPPPSSQVQHSFLQRMRSDPASRSRFATGRTWVL